LTLPKVVDHADWETQNLRRLDGRLHMVYDLDSLTIESEAALAGP
jgi:hypothetical protein